MPNGGTTASVRVPARIYPGVFPGEYQVTIKLGTREIHLNVGEAFVEKKQEPTVEGVDGHLLVQIVSVSADKDQYLVALPGEVQGEPSRIQVTRQALAMG